MTETLISGLHPPGVIFPFLPNPDLKPETAKTFEFGVNFTPRRAIVPGDGLRLKAAAFHNKVDNFIDLEEIEAGSRPDCPFLPLPPVFVPGGYYVPACYQYVNIAEATIKGFELEGVYDAGRVFAGLTLTVLDGEDEATGEPLLTVPPAEIVGRVGFRFLQEKILVGGEVQHVFGQDALPKMRRSSPTTTRWSTSSPPTRRTRTRASTCA